MNRIWNQCLKELLQFKRDRLTLALAFLLPVMTLLIFGFAIRLESKNIPLVVQNFDSGNLSQSYIERVFATNQFEPVRWSGPDPAKQAIDRGLAKVALIIPPEFSRRIKAGQPVDVQVLVDGTDANNARVIKNSIKAITLFFQQTEHLIPTTQKIQAKTRLWFNPSRKEAAYIVPGVYGLILWIYPSLLAAIAMVREKEKGTILQIYASSLTATELLLGKALAYVLVGFSVALGVMILGSLIFQLGLAGDITPLLVGTPVFLGVSVMFGLFIGVRSSNQNAAVQGVAIVGFISALLLSGFIYPLSNIPFPLSLVSLIVPARYYIDITRDAYVRGIGWPGIWGSLVMLTLLGFVLFALARKLLSRMQLND